MKIESSVLEPLLAQSDEVIGQVVRCTIEYIKTKHTPNDASLVALFEPIRLDIEKNRKKSASAEFAKRSASSFQFIAPRFYDVVDEWLEYKRLKRQSYVCERSVRMFYKDLLAYSRGDVLLAKDIVDYSIGRSYQGIFAPKYGERISQKQQDSDAIKRGIMAELGQIVTDSPAASAAAIGR